MKFDALDGEPVDIVVLCLAPPDQPGRHLGQASRWPEGLVRRLADQAFGEQLRQAASTSAMLALPIHGDEGVTEVLALYF